eukprot:jgi/Botrbrau1/4179/Bobra.0192s0039.1
MKMASQILWLPSRSLTCHRNKKILETLLKEKRKRDEQAERRDSALKDVDHLSRLQSEQALQKAAALAKEAAEEVADAALDGHGASQEEVYRQVLFLAEGPYHAPCNSVCWKSFGERVVLVICWLNNWDTLVYVSCSWILSHGVAALRREVTPMRAGPSNEDGFSDFMAPIKEFDLSS